MIQRAFWQLKKSQAKNGAATTNGDTEKINVEEKKEALLEVANAYFNKKQNIQYDSYRKQFGVKPEQATKDDILYSVCSAFTYNVYKNALDIELPACTIDLIRYAKELYSNEEYSSYIPAYYDRNKTKTLKDVVEENSNGQSFIDAIQNQVQVGDVLVYYIYKNGGDIGAGHAMLVESVKYNADGSVKSATLIHSTGQKVGDTNDYLERNGSIRRIDLSTQINNYSSSKDAAFAIIRPLANGTQYVKSPFIGDEVIGEMLNPLEEKEINITDYAKTRMKYKGIDIYKTGSAYDNADVGLGENITYTIKIKNTGKQKYDDIDVEENISDLVKIIDDGGGTAYKDKILWTGISINAGETKEINYTVTIKKDKKNLYKKIESKGNVGGIETSTVVNYIRNTFSDDENKKIIDVAETLIEQGKKEIELINAIYKTVLEEPDFSIENLNSTETLTIDEVMDDNGNLINNLAAKIEMNKLYGYGFGANTRKLVTGRDLSKANEVNNRSRVLHTNLKNGDILLTKESDNNKKIYIYIDGENSKGSRVQKIIEISSVDKVEITNQNIELDYFNANGELNKFLADLAAKDKYALIRPSYIRKEKYDIIYELNGGINSSKNPSIYTIEDKVTLENASKEGYIFEGWYDNAEFTGNKITKIEDNTGDITLYAKWEPIEYTITYDLAGGSLPQGKSNPGSYTIETENFTLNNPVKTGYTFAGWTGSNGSTKQTQVTISKGSTGNKEYTANWKANTYTITYNGNGATGGDTEKSTHEYDKEKALTVNGFTNNCIITYNHNYQGSQDQTRESNVAFSKWNTKADGTGTNYEDKQSVKNLTAKDGENINLYAQWSNTNEEITYIPERTGYTFAGWYTNSELTGERVDKQKAGSYTPTSNITLYAKWTPIEYTITYDLAGGSLPQGKSNPGSYTIETENFTLNNPQKEGYIFTGWTESNSQTPEITVTIEKGSTGNKAYTANWKKKVELQITIDSKYEIKEEDGVKYLTNIEPNTTIEAILWNQETRKIETNGEIKVYKENKEIDYLADGTGVPLLGTGYKIEITLEDKKQEYIAVVKGDLTGNGKIDQGDLLMLAKYKVGKLKEDAEDETQRITKESILASDLNSNGSNSDQGDLLMIAKIIVGRI